MKLGLTGGIGCGKSTLVGIFADLGWRTIQSDEVVRELLEKDNEIIEAVRQHWGDQMISESGRVDRGEVAKVVFSDPSELRWLEELLHPRVRAFWKGMLAADPAADWLVEIPLLFEKSLESEFDFTVCIHSPEDVVASRMESRGYSREELDRRRRSQLPIEEKIRRADYVITNAGSLEFLKEQTSRLINQLADG